MIGFITERRMHAGTKKTTVDNTPLPVVLFVMLILFLIVWSFQGKKIENAVYGTPIYQGKAGAEILLTHSNAGESRLVVGDVIPGSPAQTAGIETGDIILGIDNRIISTPDMAFHILSQKKAGDIVTFTLLRAEQTQTIHIHIPGEIQRDKASGSKSMSTGGHIIAMAFLLKLTIVMFLFIHKNMELRMQTVLLFAAIVVAAGSFFGIYNPVDAFFAIRFNTISLLVGMYIISTILDYAGFFDSVAHRLYLFAGTDRTRIMILFCILTYIFSLFVNNLTTILVMIPMTLKLAARTGFDPRPIVIGEVIASNIGGASTMLGDFPNMLISSEANIGFNEFIIFMMPIGMVLFATLLVYLWRKLDLYENLTSTDKEKNKENESENCENTLEKSKLKSSTHARHTSIRQLERTPVLTLENRKTIRRALFILFHMILLFILSQRLSLNTSAIALTGGLSLFLFSGINKNEIIRKMSFRDALFFTGLFIVVGGLEASGLLQYVTRFITALSLGKPWLCCLLLMWSAAFITAFLSAGPATALFFPVVAGMVNAPPGHIIWWSLSLGVLAGSSATVMGATAGPVAATLVEEFASRYALQLKGGNTLKSGLFSKTGIPVAIIMLSISTIYILMLNAKL
ncbi:Putative transporter, magnetosome protein MamN [Desulfamplus magnetovallimortis]|uniref:Putative transporter, magnetosome protein MamN n=1 Tax=Desulfamplus magnetovallimortis TaxID=1246637 RepID=L0R3W4_9BACT|nr:SLC13 family permease [Desulfamplus magnetovallimortis]CCO06688.1 Putative transporter, magnetosome protein MamN [Desulfamplus magnetovallimortis BW-1]SLM32739.1 Putative transporter, magnetosome protein MamN [Desulfamplus magnetovallimortis]